MLQAFIPKQKKLGIETAYGMIHGIKGLLNEDIIKLEDYLESEENRTIKKTPSALLGSCHYKLPKIMGNEDVYEKMFTIAFNSIK